MSKKLFLFGFLLLLVFPSFCQTKIVSELQQGNLEAESIVEFENITSSEIYKSSLEWISYSFRNTESVMQSQVENKMIRFKGISTSVFGPILGISFDLSYVIQLDIKNGKLRFRASNLQQIAQVSPFTKTSLESLYKKNGELRNGNRAIKFKNQLDNELSELITSLKNKIEGETETKDDDW